MKKIQLNKEAYECLYNIYLGVESYLGNKSKYDQKGLSLLSLCGQYRHLHAIGQAQAEIIETKGEA